MTEVSPRGTGRMQPFVSPCLAYSKVTLWSIQSNKVIADYGLKLTFNDVYSDGASIRGSFFHLDHFDHVAFLYCIGTIMFRITTEVPCIIVCRSRQ